MKFKEILPNLSFAFKSESDLIDAIQEVSTYFTTQRTELSRYLTDPRLNAAYTAFYLTTNIPKFAAVLKWLPQDFVELFKKCIFIDVGAGPGTFSLAFRSWLNNKSQGIFQIENSELMRKEAQRIWAHYYPNEMIDSLASSEVGRIPNDGDKLMLFGHSANEMQLKEVMNYVTKLKPHHLLFIEPGTKDFFVKMMSIREELIQLGYNIMYPCPNSHSCPMLKHSDDWCHQFLNLVHEPEIERLSQMARKDRRHLPIIFQAYSLSAPTSAQIENRIVRVFPETKFSYEWEACGGDEISQLQVMKRNLSKEKMEQMAAVRSGDAIQFEIDKITQQNTRIKVISIN